MLKQVECEINGLVAMLCKSGAMADPIHPIARQLKAITDKRSKKTDADMEELDLLKWKGSLWLTQDNKPGYPGENIEAGFRKAAPTGKKDAVLVGLMCEGTWPLIYDGPRDLDKLYECGKFIDRRMAVVNRARIPVVRPRFDSWALKFSLDYDDRYLSFRQIQDWLVKAGEHGYGDYRPRFGRFEVVSCTEK